MWNKRASSLVVWSVVFAIVVASLGLFRITLKRTLQNKMAATADYMMWMAYHDQNVAGEPAIYKQPVEYVGSTNLMSKANATNNVTVRQLEAHKRPVRTIINSAQGESSVHSTVSTGNELILKTFDLNTVVQ